MKTILHGLIAASLISICWASEDGLKTYDVIGVVKKLKPDIRTAVIHHEEIPGYMDEMVMSLEVKDTAEFKGIGVGDKIRFRMNVTEDDGWIDQLKLIEKREVASSSENEPVPLTVISPGELLPEANLVNDSGEAFSLSSYEGNAFALTFIYTRCPFPTFCPRVNQQFKEAQEILKNDAESPKNWKLLSVTIEPDRDTPEVLAAFVKVQEADPAHWRFATGSLRDITRLTVQSGLNFWDDRGLIQHNLRTIVVDPAGRVTKVFGEDELTAESLAKELKAATKVPTCSCSEKKP